MVLRDIPDPNMTIPEKGIDISAQIEHVFAKIKNFFMSYGSNLTFTQLLPSDRKTDKVQTLIPLLHLTNMRKIDIHQDEPFGEINIAFLKSSASKNEINKELGTV